MSGWTVTKTRFAGGVWEGVVTGGGRAGPEIEVVLGQDPVAGVTLAPLKDGGHLLRVPVPVEALGDGVLAFVIRDRVSEETLARFAVLAGEAAGEGLEAEVALLRAELDLLKRAFRRHCVETATQP